MNATDPNSGEPSAPRAQDQTGILAPPIDLTFEQLFDREYTTLVRIAYLIVGGEERAEEVVQEAFASLHTRWDTVRNPGGFLRTAVVNRSKDEQRHQIRARAKLRLLRPTADATTERPYLVDALAKLPNRRRAVVVLRYYGGHSLPEIAEITGMAVGTVKSTLHRALGDLRAELDDDSLLPTTVPVLR